MDPFTLSGSCTNGSGHSDHTLARATNYAANLDYALSPGKRTLGPVRVSPTGIRFRSSLAGTDGSRFTYAVPIARDSDALLAPALSRSKAWRTAGGADFGPLTGLQ